MDHPSEWSEEVRQALLAPFEKVEWVQARGGGGAFLAYVNADDVCSRLDAVVGPGGWSFELEMVDTGVGRIQIGRMTVLGSTKCDIGEEHSKDLTEPVKSCAHDALKRCARLFGVGRYLKFLPRMKPRQGYTMDDCDYDDDLQVALARAGWRGDGKATSVPEDAVAPRTGRPSAQALAKSQGSGRPAPGPASGETSGKRANGGDGPTPPCGECGTALTSGQHKMSLAAYGRPLCPEHQKGKERLVNRPV